MDGHPISFGPYRLLAAQRLLLEGDRPVRLGSRAFDILAALVERAGEVVGKEQLIARAWPQTFVEESNLKIQVSALRRALGDGQDGNRYVITVPGRGYNFVAPVRREETMRAASAPPVPSTTPHNLPFAVTRMIGRDDAVAALVTRLSRQRMVTVVGAGGIGKTTVALAVAERMMASYEHGVWLVDLAPLSDPRLVPSAVATVLGLQIRGEDPLLGLIDAIKDNRMLLLFDNCEHVIDAAAGLVTAVLSRGSGVRILATSREPLGTTGESEYHLEPLGLPPASSRLTAAEAARFPAVQLFVERVSAIVEDFGLTDANAPAVVEICRRLDGLPLAIEFAAPRVEVLGVEGLAARLDDSLQLVGARRRTTMPRHRTMRAVVDWSYGLLSGDEQLFFRALGIFKGGFTVEAAEAVAADVANPREATDRLTDLVAKSLVVADICGTKPRFRLLDTTRAYAIEKLDESGERERVARRHGEYYCDLFAHAEREVLARSRRAWLADCAQELDNLRAALDWAFSPAGGDVSVGIALTAAALPLWMYLSLIGECHRRVTRALTALSQTASADAHLEMKLQSALAASLVRIGAAAKMEAACTRTLDLAERLGDLDYQLRALWGLWILKDREALALAQQFAAVASTPADRLIGAQMLGHSYHYRGDQVSARRYLERAIANQRAIADAGPRIIRFFVENQPTRHLARVLWLQGLSEQAMAMVERLVEQAKAEDHANSLCHALAVAACPIALWVGNLNLAERYVDLLHETLSRHGLTSWQALGRAHRGVLLIKQGNLQAGLPQLRAAFEELRAVPPGLRFMFFAELPESLAAGQTSGGLATIEEVIDRAERTAEGWIIAELLRIKGELLRLDGSPGALDSAEACFLQALQLAGTQGALAWELRVATSVARLHRARNRSAEAIACLRPIYDRFTEGFGTADLVSAKQLLDELSDADRR